MLLEGEMSPGAHQQLFRAAPRAKNQCRRRIVDREMHAPGERAVRRRQRFRRHLAQLVGRLGRRPGVEQGSHQQHAQRQIVRTDGQRLFQSIDCSAIHGAGVINFRST